MQYLPTETFFYTYYFEENFLQRDKKLSVFEEEYVNVTKNLRDHFEKKIQLHTLLKKYIYRL